jgi:uncharacterized damage-inducible protein DinB
LFSDINNYIKARIELDNKIIEFVDELNETDLESILKFKNSKGIDYEKKMDGVLIHLFNHETHHRGMIAQYLDMLEIDNDFNSALPFV